jgi:hypothetical protein
METCMRNTMKSYLSGRQQEVDYACIQLGTTTCCIVKYGVSHTSFHNNPLLFILYINALPLYIESTIPLYFNA